MSSWLDPVRAALAGAVAPVNVFFRDDDAGWSDQHLYRLLDQFERHAIPLDVAVIPEALHAQLASNLIARWQGESKLLGVHQHGYSHSNHEPSGRKCEFGAGRSRDDQWHDLVTGRERLGSLLGAALDPIFTPPWNRCNQVTVDCLQSLGYRALSRDATAVRLELNGLAEVSVSVDWCRLRNEAANAWPVFDQRIAGALLDPGPTGIMLHHAVMGADDFGALAELLGLFNTCDNVRCWLMRDIAGSLTPTYETNKNSS
jgi:hypothetical protein